MGTNRRFQTRSGSRDQATDLSRRTVILRAVQTQLSAITHERDGLSARLDSHLARAVFVEQVGGDWSERSSEDERDLRELDTAISTARRRLQGLEGESGLMERIARLLEEPVLGSDPLLVQHVNEIEHADDRQDPGPNEKNKG